MAITVSKQRLAWVAHRVRLKQLILNIKKVCAEDNWPAQTVLFLSYLVYHKSVIPNTFLLPFENKMLAFKRKENIDSYTEEKRQTMLVSCFLIVKLLVAKVMFKPYKITSAFGKGIDFVKNKQTFKENCVSMGYTLIAVLTDYLFELFADEFAAKGADLKKQEVVRKIKDKIF